MAEAIVWSAAQNLGTLLSEKAKFLHGVRGQVEQMQIELRRMQSFLQDADNRQDKDAIVRNWVSEIRELAYDIDDVIDSFVLNSQRRGGIKNVLKRSSRFIKELQLLDEVGSEIEAIKLKISNLTSAMQTYGIRPQRQGEGSSSTYMSQQQLRRSYSHVEQDIVVGFEEDIKILVARLVDEEKPHQVVSICGMGGLGKTTLAKKVYHHRDVRSHFDGFAWAYVSQQCQTRDVWEGLLIELTSPSPKQRKEISKLRDEELAKKLYQVQQEKKYLVILDDIWSTVAWNSLSPAFPLGESGSKILLTSRNREVALYVNPSGFLHDLHFLDNQESWELFKKKALPREYDLGFFEVGRAIVKRCGGLPLAIVVLGGFLVTKDLTEWERVLGNVDSYLRTSIGHGSVVQKVLALSYHDLPYHLKPCFLYLSHFHEDFNIPAKKLTQMWVAEGFVSTIQDTVQGEENLVEIAEEYLNELIDRCMVQVGKVSLASGRIKYCRLHDLMRDLCISIAKQENFFSFIALGDGDEQIEFASMLSSGRVRRLAIFGNHQDTKRSILPSKYERNFHLRSLLFPKGNEILVKEKQLKSIFNKFRLLRVFSLVGITIPSRRRLRNRIVCSFCLPCFIIPPLCKLLGLPCGFIIDKFIDLEISLDPEHILKLPSSIGHLRCLQILNLQVDDLSEVVIPNVIWKMERLRHVYFPDDWSSIGKIQLGNLSNLQTLVNFRADKGVVKDLIKLTNLRKLSLYSKDRTSLKKFVEMLGDPRVTLYKLRSLRLRDFDISAQKIDISRIVSGCPQLYKLLVGGELEKLPSYEQFHSKITKLILGNSRLKEDPMPTLEKLPNLRVLRLGYGAFDRQKMVCSKEGFRQLKSILFYLLEGLEEWWVEEGAMPNLHRLEIWQCERLMYVPGGLRFITTLRELEIRDMPAEFEERLKEKGEDFYKIQQVPSVSYIKTSIFQQDT